jgi:2-dehydropantoate 2-reductase
VPLGQAVLAAGGPGALADDPDAVRAMIRLMRQNLAAFPAPSVPRGFAALQTLPEGLLVALVEEMTDGGRGIGDHVLTLAMIQGTAAGGASHDNG